MLYGIFFKFDALTPNFTNGFCQFTLLKFQFTGFTLLGCVAGYIFASSIKQIKVITF